MINFFRFNNNELDSAKLNYVLSRNKMLINKDILSRDIQSSIFVLDKEKRLQNILITILLLIVIF